MDLAISDLSVARGGLPILSGVSFRLRPGAVLALRGPNGIGKTTLLRTIAGLQPALSGAIDGAAERIAYAGHADGIKSMLTVAENLTFWAAIFGQTGIDPALVAFELTALKDRPAGTLSAGQKRRLGLARLMVTGRSVWILDEPTVSLDTRAVQCFAAAVRAHLGQGGSALIATHADLGLDAPALDLAPFRATPDTRVGSSDEAFL
ncbi:heme ABC exporter ATP-binding protein CcmA [Sulfitobacter sp. LCG007]